MIYAILAAVVSSTIAYIFFKKSQDSKNEIQQLEYDLQRAEEKAARNLHIIKSMEEVNREAAKKKKSIRTGSNRDNARSATDIMRDISEGRRKDDPPAVS